MLNSKHILALSIMCAVTITSLGIAIRSYRHEPTTRTTRNMQSWGISDDTPFTVMRRKPDTVIPTAVGMPLLHPNGVQASQSHYWFIGYHGMDNFGTIAYGNIIISYNGTPSDTGIMNLIYPALKCKNPTIPKKGYSIVSLSEVPEDMANTFYLGAPNASTFTAPCPDKPVSHAMLIEAPVQLRYYDTIPVEFRHSPEDTILLLTPDKH